MDKIKINLELEYNELYYLYSVMLQGLNLGLSEKADKTILDLLEQIKKEARKEGVIIPDRIQ